MISADNRSKRVFWQGAAILTSENLDLKVDCRVLQGAPLRGGDVVIECREVSVTGALSLPLQDSVSVSIPGVPEPLDLLLTNCSWNSDGLANLTFILKRSPCWFSRPGDLRFGRFVTVNFAEFWMGSPAMREFELRGGGWTARFIPFSDKTLALPGWIDNDDYRITHQVEFLREDGAHFTALQAQDFLRKLSLFLSFCRGHWVACCLTVAVDSTGEMVLEQWGTGRVSRWLAPSGWLDEYHGMPICELFGSFFSRLRDESWTEAIDHVVYWFTRADTNYLGPDGACILLQATLERLAWHILVRERRAISEKGFSELAAADQLRLMLNVLSIPTAVPDGLSELKTLGMSRGFGGPEIFTYIRNRLTHPPKISAKKEDLPIYEAYCLGKWYVELVILSVCGFVGEYGNRTASKRWKGQVEKVPWAQ